MRSVTIFLLSVLLGTASLSGCGVKNEPRPAPPVKAAPQPEKKIDGVPLYKPDEGGVSTENLDRLSMLGNDYGSDDYRYSDTLKRRFEGLYPEGTRKSGFKQRPLRQL